MKLRTGILVAVVGALLMFAFGPGRADERDAAAKKLTRADIDAMMTSLSNWGRWGKEDELGALNLITPEKRRQAAMLVQEGVTVSMAHNVIKTEQAASPEFGHTMTAIPQAADITSASD